MFDDLKTKIEEYAKTSGKEKLNEDLCKILNGVFQSKEEKYIQIPLESNSILWRIYPKVHVTENDGVLVELQWGWTAGMTEEDLENYAEDAPTGYESVTTNLDSIKELVEDLQNIIHKYEKQHEELIKNSKQEKTEGQKELLKLFNDKPAIKFLDNGQVEVSLPSEMQNKNEEIQGSIKAKEYAEKACKNFHLYNESLDFIDSQVDLDEGRTYFLFKCKN